jgi:hypothetical protein
MDISPDFTLHCIGKIRGDHDLVRALLHRACEDVAVYRDTGAISEVDLAVDKARVAFGKVSGVRPSEVSKVLGPEAASALTDIRSAVSELEDMFGMTAGPDRTEEQLEATAKAITPLFYKARDRFNDWDRATKGIRIPGRTEMPPSLGDVPPHVKPVRTVPIVRPRFSSEQVAKLARSVLGTSYAMAAITYGRISVSKPEDRQYAGLAGILNFAPIMAHLSARADLLRNRASVDDAPFTELLGIAAEEAQRFYRLATEKLSTQGVGQFDFVLSDCKQTAQLLARMVRQADKLIAERGLVLDAPAPETVAPAP